VIRPHPVVDVKHPRNTVTHSDVADLSRKVALASWCFGHVINTRCTDGLCGPPAVISSHYDV